MLFDMTELGDLSKRALGGSGQDAGVLEQNFGKIFELLDTVQGKKQGGTFSRVFIIHYSCRLIFGAFTEFRRPRLYVFTV